MLGALKASLEVWKKIEAPDLILPGTRGALATSDEERP